MSGFLEVEDDEQRQNRIGTLLERLNTTSASPAIPNLTLRERPPIEPPTELLSRVQAFLPAISASNAALADQNPEDLDIEHVAEDEDRYIEMNLGLGVLEAKPRGPGSRSSPSSDAASPSDVSSSESASDSDSSTSSSEADSESDSDSATFSSDDSDTGSQSGSSIDMKPISSRPMKPLPRRVSQQAKVEV